MPPSIFEDELCNSYQVPDFLNARINGLPVKEVIKDKKWLEEEFTESIQKVRLWNIYFHDSTLSVIRPYLPIILKT